MKKRSKNLSLKKISIAKLIVKPYNIIGGVELTNGAGGGPVCNYTYTCPPTVTLPPPTGAYTYCACNTTSTDTNNATGVQCSPDGSGQGPMPGGGLNETGSCNYCY
ncbi:hypothetical protein GTQ40_17750 [Flavobacteriaceae bacterium R38]|nr:hypothetical protein [Flavobacteriaceae bacterium R38]